ncbi:prorelaxin precursor [Mesocricetus auratus]|uniref:Prorelaxin n=1 Tax=Mesocricetus auratus TaxID=10036 RepID=RELX_MESAU|nr:prorelaxin precursor [Mesocricetus auratus]Q64171.1 RecName: Full=Prorelaxin; Contains: RecName: Full=Relaxin B chain; Contains: RecName: Full=Relaxin A chain; Flags: Precursor [Mesocricetus auratus]AAB35655.1 prorelaxin [Mesocricetus auratus]
MSCKFVLQLLGFWLLLSQPCRARVTKEWLDEVIHVCGREYVRAILDICAATVGLEAPPLRRRRMTEEAVSSFIKEDAEPFDTMPNLSEKPKTALPEGHPSLPEQQQYVPVSSDSVGSLDDFKKSFHATQGEAEDSSLPELKSLYLDTLSRKKRYTSIYMSHQCCFRGCSRRSLTAAC